MTDLAETLTAVRNQIVYATDELAQLIQGLADEVQRARSFKSLPPGMVWQDYYSPDDVLKVMAERDNELDRLRALQRDDQDTAEQAIAERDAALAKFARVEALADDWYDSVPMWALREALTGEPGDRQ